MVELPEITDAYPEPEAAARLIGRFLALEYGSEVKSETTTMLDLIWIRVTNAKLMELTEAEQAKMDLDAKARDAEMKNKGMTMHIVEMIMSPLQHRQNAAGPYFSAKTITDRLVALENLTGFRQMQFADVHGDAVAVFTRWRKPQDISDTLALRKRQNVKAKGI